MRKLQPLDIIFMVTVIATMIMGVFTIFLIAENRMFSFVRLDTMINTEISRNRFFLMDQLAPHLRSLYFWIPFYCMVLLILVGLNRIKFLRICAVLVSCLVIMSGIIGGFNALAIYSAEHKYIPVEKSSNIVPPGDYFSLSTLSAVSFGFAVFVSLYLDKRYWPLRLTLFVWAVLIDFAELYQGALNPGNLILSLAAGSLIAAGFNTVVQYLSINNILYL